MLRFSEVIVEAITVRLVSSYSNLVRELLSALCSAAGENLTAVSVRHSLAEAVLHLAMTLLGLISPFHSCITSIQGVIYDLSGKKHIGLIPHFRPYKVLLYNKNVVCVNLFLCLGISCD